jgi:hypothetical protein
MKPTNTTPEQRVKFFEKQIMGQFDSSFQAFDLEEVLATAWDDVDRIYCWNAAMNLVQQGRCHVIQVRPKNSPAASVRWIMVAFPPVVLDNSSFRPPGMIVEK